VRFEQDRPGAVVPGAPNPEQDVTFGRELERILRDRWTEHVAGEMLQSLAVARGHGHVGVKVEPCDVGVPFAARRHPGCIGIATDTGDRLAGVPAGCGPSEDRRAADAREEGRLARKRIEVVDLVARAIEIDAMTPREPRDSATD
jgi:hypothetical protein